MKYKSYLIYPLAQLQWWKKRAERVGHSRFARICAQAIAHKYREMYPNPEAQVAGAGAEKESDD